MKTTQTNEAVLAEGVAGILDANDELERQLVHAAKTVGSSWKIQTREAGEKIYWLLDRLNGRIEGYTQPKALAKASEKAQLRKRLAKAEADVLRMAAPLRKFPNLEDLQAGLDQWSATYKQLVAALDDKGEASARELRAAA